MMMTLMFDHLNEEGDRHRELGKMHNVEVLPIKTGLDGGRAVRTGLARRCAVRSGVWRWLDGRRSFRSIGGKAETRVDRVVELVGRRWRDGSGC